MVHHGEGDVTRLLDEWAHGSSSARDALIAVVYSELRKIADGYLRRERSSHTLQPTALVHEAWMRLVKQNSPSFDSRKQFYALAAQLMRRILVDHARSLRAEKRGGGDRATPLPVALQQSDTLDELLCLHDALTDLARLSPRQAQVIELRYFGGLEGQEVADLLNVSSATVARDQKAAEAWLSFAMSRPARVKRDEVRQKD